MKLTNAELRKKLRAAQRRIGELEQRNRRLWELSHIDELTGLLNRRAIVARLGEEVARSIRYRTSLAVVLADLDHFKRINDTHGHLAGDLALRHMARRLRQYQRDTDIAGRYGGEEFLLVLPSTDRTGAEQLCRRLRNRLNASGARWKKHPLLVTASFGVAELGVACCTARDLLETADRRLYDAKARGRNRVVA